MSMGSNIIPKSRYEIEREAGIFDSDASKPLLLKLVEYSKYGLGGS